PPPRATDGLPKRCNRKAAEFLRETWGCLNTTSERTFLGERKSWKGYAAGVLRHFNSDCRSIGSRYFGGPQHSILRENFVVELGDQKVLAGFVFAPDLTELNGVDRHRRSCSRVKGGG